MVACLLYSILLLVICFHKSLCLYINSLGQLRGRKKIKYSYHTLSKKRNSLTGFFFFFFCSHCIVFTAMILLLRRRIITPDSQSHTTLSHSVIHGLTSFNIVEIVGIISSEIYTVFFHPYLHMLDVYVPMFYILRLHDFPFPS